MNILWNTCKTSHILWIELLDEKKKTYKKVSVTENIKVQVWVARKDKKKKYSVYKESRITPIEHMAIENCLRWDRHVDTKHIVVLVKRWVNWN